MSNKIKFVQEEPELPKGMNKIPDEYSDQEVIPEKHITHEDCNYTGIIREALKELESKGLLLSVQKIEVVESVEHPTILSVLLEVRESK